MQKTTPLPIFDSLEYLKTQEDFSYLTSDYDLKDIKIALQFLKSYQGSAGTFNSYRREIERLLHWNALIVKKNLNQIKREDIEAFIKFSLDPPITWIGTTKPPRFILKDGIRSPNPQWKPFNAHISKRAHKEGEQVSAHNFELSLGSIRETFAILSSFFNYLLQEEHVQTNPVLLVRQKSKFVRKTQQSKKIRRLSALQWEYVIKTITDMSAQNPLYERHLFIMCSLYSMYLRISELTENARWCPKMNDFARDHEDNWWFTTVGKGNKERQIAVSESMLNALKRWRKYLNLAPLPSPADDSPLLPKSKGRGGIKSANFIRDIVQFCFDAAIQKLKTDGFEEEALNLHEATVHWLRHTGISDDVKIRPREHVRDDAGHSSSAITDKYIDIELRERHRSARKKLILVD